MPLKSGLEVYLYNLAGSSTVAPIPYGNVITALQFTSVAPGGLGDLAARISLRDARLPRYEFSLFSRIAVMDGFYPVWLGELSEPKLGLDPESGEYVELAALGLGNCLRDDPRDDSYSANTVQQIAVAQLTTGNRANFLPLDQDTSLLFPDNPAGTISPVYPMKTMEEVIQDVVTQAGGLTGNEYVWGVWPHANYNPLSGAHSDSAGYATGQLVCHLRDTATTHYQGLVEAGDVLGWLITPSMERAYNRVAIRYNDPSQATPVATAIYTDPRLAGSGAQGTAPFRRRTYAQDFSGISTITKSQAQNVAQTYGQIYQNVTNKVSIVLRRIRDTNGVPFNLWRARADHNIAVPALSVRGTPLALALTAGINQFYILQTTYQEDDTGHTLSLDCDNFSARGDMEVARLQLIADVASRTGGTTTGVVQALGAPLKGVAGHIANPTAASETVAVAIDYGSTLSQNTTSLTLSATINSNTSGVSATNQTVYGALLQWTAPSAASNTQWYGTWQTNGNCLLDVDEARETFDHHCDICAQAGRVAIRRGLSLRRHVVVRTDLHPSEGHLPGRSALNVECPGCHNAQGLSLTVESYNTNLGPEDEDDDAPANHPWRAKQARLIRRLMRAHGLPTRETSAAV